MTKMRKVLLSLAIVGVTGSLISFGVFAAFSATTSNPNNSFAAGTVSISDNDGGTAAYSVSNRKPGDFAESCVRVTYTGSLANTIKLYRSAFTGGTGLDQYVDLAITKGTGTAADCSDFSGSTSVYSGTLNALGSNWAGGTALTNGSNQASWSQNDAVTYRVRATLQDNNAAQGLATGTHSLVFEAQSN
jgi:predicted ribosomally synthesized peptide with SipW-like signal peptide